MTSTTRSGLRRAVDVAAILPLAILAGWAMPRIDGPDGARWLFTVGFCVLGSTVVAVHDRRLLGRSASDQAITAAKAVGIAVATVVLCAAASLALGSHSEAPAKQILGSIKIPADLQSPAARVFLVGFVVLALLSYRGRKRRDAELRAQAAAERAVVAEAAEPA